MGFEEIKHAEVGLSDDDYKVTEFNYENVIKHITQDCINRIRLTPYNGFYLTLDNSINSMLLSHILDKTGMDVVLFIPDFLDEEETKQKFKLSDKVTFTTTPREDLFNIYNVGMVDNYLNDWRDTYLPLGDLLPTDIRFICGKLDINTDNEVTRFNEEISIRELEWAIMYIQEYTYDNVFDDTEVWLMNERERDVISMVVPLTRGNINATVCEIGNDILF